VVIGYEIFSLKGIIAQRYQCKINLLTIGKRLQEIPMTKMTISEVELKIKELGLSCPESQGAYLVNVKDGVYVVEDDMNNHRAYNRLFLGALPHIRNRVSGDINGIDQECVLFEEVIELNKRGRPPLIIDGHRDTNLFGRKLGNK
jgi:hypothetical protein